MMSLNCLRCILYVEATCNGKPTRYAFVTVDSINNGTHTVAYSFLTVVISDEVVESESDLILPL